MKRKRESIEDYLETILILRERNGQVRSIDIVNELGYSRPSVSVAMKKLREKNFIRMDADRWITFTPDGEKFAVEIYSRHRILNDFLVGIGVDPEIAASEACLIEHDISEHTFSKIRALVEKGMKG